MKAIPKTNDEIYEELQTIRQDQQRIVSSLKHIIEALAELTELEDEAAGIDMEQLKQNSDPDKAYH